MLTLTKKEAACWRSYGGPGRGMAMRRSDIAKAAIMARLNEQEQ